VPAFGEAAMLHVDRSISEARPMKGAITGLAIIHLAVTVWHGNAHQALGVHLPPEKNIFVYVVIVVAPIVGAFLAWTRYRLAGAWVFALSMLGALLFGLYHHYVGVSPDHIRHLPSGDAGAQSAFVISAAGLALLESAGTALGVFWVRELRRPREEMEGDARSRRARR
jgi:hypothetical protein